jgi:hypothetical protein
MGMSDSDRGRPQRALSDRPAIQTKTTLPPVSRATSFGLPLNPSKPHNTFTPKVVPYEDRSSSDDDFEDEKNDYWERVTPLSTTSKDPCGESATFRRALKKNNLRKFDVNGHHADLRELIERADNCYVRAWLWFAFPEMQAKITAKMGYKNFKYFQAMKIGTKHVLAIVLCFVVQVAFPGLMLQQEYSRDCEQPYSLDIDTTAFSLVETLQHMIRSAHIDHLNETINGTEVIISRTGCQDLCQGTGDLNTRCFAVLLALYAFGEMFETVRECQVMMRLHYNSRASHFARLILVLGCWAQLVSFVFLLLCTSALFIRQPEYKDLLLNAVALTFVLEIDNRIEVQDRHLLLGIEKKLVAKPKQTSADCSLACITRLFLAGLVQLLSVPLDIITLILGSVVMTMLVGSCILLMMALSAVYISICI